MTSKKRLFFPLMVSAVVSLGVTLSAHALDFRSNALGCTTKNCAYWRNGTSARPRIFRIQAPRPPTGATIGPWRLVRTPAPDNKETVSIMRTGELIKSDPDFAGLMIRCKGTAGIQVGFIVVSPFPPKSQPLVTVSTGKSSLDFPGSVASPGTIVSLPDEAGVLVQGPWLSARSLTVRIKGDGANIYGTVSLNKLSQAIALLQANCPPQ